MSSPLAEELLQLADSWGQGKHFGECAAELTKLSYAHADQVRKVVAAHGNAGQAEDSNASHVETEGDAGRQPVRDTSPSAETPAAAPGPRGSKLDALNAAFRCAYIECPAHVIDDLKRRFDEYLAEQLAAARASSEPREPQYFASEEMGVAGPILRPDRRLVKLMDRLRDDQFIPNVNVGELRELLAAARASGEAGQDESELCCAGCGTSEYPFHQVRLCNACFAEKIMGEVELDLSRRFEPELRDALNDCKEALDSIWAAIGDALCSGKGITEEYGNAVATECREAKEKASAALANSQPVRGAGA